MASSFVGILATTLLTLAASIQVVGAQTLTVPDDVVIKLQRTSCYGPCPIYTVTIDAVGNVNYEGAKNVRVVGHQTDRIPLSDVRTILDTAERIGFFALEDHYRFIQNPDGSSTTVSDGPTAFVTITREGRSKVVEDYIGAPAGLPQLEHQIDEIARTKRWIWLDAPTLEQLVRDGWSPTAAERAELFQRAIGEDDAAIVRRLIELGADPNGGDSGTSGHPLTRVQSAAMAQQLIDAGANPNAASGIGWTPLASSVYLAPDVAQVLLKAGAHVDGPADRTGRTALWYAACKGNADLVAILLAAGADPTLRASGPSALDCTREARESERWRKRLSEADPKTRYVTDFDRAILLLEQALAQRERR